MELLRRMLQEELGSSPRVKLETFCNWATTQKIEDVLAVRPRSIAEIKKVVRAAHAMKLRVRCVGAGHSLSSLYADKGHVILYTKHIKSDYANGEQISKMETTDGTLVTVMAGVSIKEMKEFQLKHNVCIPCSVNLTTATIGGVIATGSHGIGKTDRTLSEHIVKMRVVDSHGDIRTFTSDNRNMMRALRCHLGLFGVVIDVTFLMSPMFKVETKTEFSKVAELFSDPVHFKNIIDSNWSVEIVWFPFNSMLIPDGIEAVLKRTVSKEDWNPQNDELLLRTINKSNDPSQKCEGERLYKWNHVEDWLPEAGITDLDDMVRQHGYYTPQFLKRGFQNLKEQTQERRLKQEITNAIHWKKHDLSIPTLQFEVSQNVDEKLSCILESVNHVIKKIQEEATRGRFPINLAVQLNFTGSSKETFLSPATVSNESSDDTGIVCNMEISGLPGTPGLDQCFLDIAKNWLSHSPSLPHLGKTWTFIDGIDEHLRKVYGENMKKFIHALDKSDIDPDGLFLNYRLQNIFFPDLDDRRQTFLIETEKVYEMAMSEDQGCLCALS